MKIRLVELDSKTKLSKVVDKKRLHHETEQLRNLLLTLTKDTDTLRLREKLLPICEGILDGKIESPLYSNDLPVKITRVFDSGEDFPDGFLEIYATFSITATGGRVDYDRCFVQDGKLWAWMEFDD